MPSPSNARISKRVTFFQPTPINGGTLEGLYRIQTLSQLSREKEGGVCRKLSPNKTCLNSSKKTHILKTDNKSAEVKEQGIKILQKSYILIFLIS